MYGHNIQMYGISIHTMGILAEILSSNIRAEIFRNLFGVEKQSLHLREIERRTGFAVGTVQQEIKKLLRLDIITRIKNGNRSYYKANTNHPLYPEIRNLVLKTNGLADLLKQALSAELKIKIAFVFGSFARKEEKAASDIDLMVIGDIGLRKLTGLLMDVSEKLGREINPYRLTESEFIKRKREKDHFLQEVLASPKIFITGTEDELEAMG
ncbi:MAG TPA: nucleotidyltransferase domain-containing protein [Smithellaceae bacterium]|nr:nucleotidyltransferase domain-containing protein [Smithellaceae bacterium]HPV71808.1 nucleotidyltransferase domain-containing protein [Smithellaceae bacterium]HQP05711.1 nucleotidyltransferase domain-containing protein [Smithellaceae bacterium]